MGAGEDFARGEEAVAEVLGEAGGGGESGDIALVAVAGDGGGDELVQAAAGGVFAGGEDFGGGSEGPGCEGGEREGGDVPGGADFAGGGDGGWLGEFAPCLGVGGEDAEGVAFRGEDLVALVDGDVLVWVDLGAGGMGDGGDFFLHGAAEGVGIAVEEDGLGAGLGEEAGELGVRGSLADDEAAAECLEVAGEDLQ